MAQRFPRRPLTRARCRSPAVTGRGEDSFHRAGPSQASVPHLAPRQRGEVGRALASPGEGPSHNRFRNSCEAPDKSGAIPANRPLHTFMKTCAVALCSLALAVALGCESNSEKGVDARPDGQTVCPGRGPTTCISGYHDDPVTCLCTPDATRDALDAADVEDTRPPDPRDADDPCEGREEAACGATPACFALRGVPLADYCRGSSSTAYAGCVSGGPDGGGAETWARQESTGKESVFPTTQLPSGWTAIASPACPGDAGVD
jgi:hypothetical protein